MLRSVISILANQKDINHLKLSARSFYDARSRNDTIFAPSTAIDPVKGSPLGVIRVSGDRTSHIIKSVTSFPDGASREISDFIKPRHARLTKFVAPQYEDLIDVGLLLWFPKPNSYTGEDSCEFHLHGSRAIMKKMLGILGAIDGVRPAEPGEFTRRAVSNNKMSLIQAESLSDLVASQTDNQRKLALEGMSGSTKDKYQTWITQLLNILAHLEASIDFGEDELIGEKIVVNDCIMKVKLLYTEISKHVSVSSQCRDLIKDGFRVVILGKPNVGKSTLMNILCNREKSIVSDVVGTTRDIVEHSFELNGHSVILSDTAGLREEFATNSDPSNRHNLIEKEGIRRALKAAEGADLIFYMVDGSVLPNFDEDKQVIIRETREVFDKIGMVGDSVQPRPVHVVVNKIDLNKTLDYMAATRQINEMLGSFQNVDTSFVSCKTQENFNDLLVRLSSRLDQLALIDRSNSNDHSDAKLHYVNERHLSLLKTTIRHLERASNLDIFAIDEMAQHVREAVDYLSRIVGTVTNEQVFDIIFKDFCIGK